MSKYIFFLFTFFSNNLFGQNADCFRRFEFQKIIDNNNNQSKAVISNYTEQKILAQAYYNTENHVKCLEAIRCLHKNFNPLIEDDYILLIQSLLQNGLYTESDSIKYFLAQNSDDINLKTQHKWETDSTVIIKKLLGSSPQGEYDLQLVNNTSGFITKIGNNKNGETTNWLGQPNFEIFNIALNDSSYSINEIINTRLINNHFEFNAIDRFGNIYFTTNDINNSTKRDIHPLQIKFLQPNPEGWKLKNLNINQEIYNNAHLSFSPNNKQIVFASDRPNGFGKSDIYVANIKTHSVDTLILEEPINLGLIVNTKFRETFPVFQNDSTIIFSSDGRFAYGGLDLIKYNIYSKELEILPKPYNSEKDDLSHHHYDSFSIITSNRGNDIGYNDDIYKITTKPPSILPEKPVKIPLIVELSDPLNNQKLSRQWIVIENRSNFEDRQILQTDVSGRLFVNDFNYSDSLYLYAISAEPCNYKYITSNNIFILRDTARLVLSPEKRKIGDELGKELQLGDELGKELQLKSIRYELDKFEITEVSKLELNILANFLTKYPNINIELQSHTDARGSDAYNLKLSNNRAKAAKDYVVSLGVDPNRIVRVGFGESRLLNSCGNTIKCPESDHEINRRTEYVITKFNPCNVIVKPQLSNLNDSDNDGINDARDGFYDTDNDGVPNYLDPK